ncbi:hypothetical protein NPIL_53321 [Nephila pilipes]|uniref:Uncharacterized protein n=1 Tax=Nephila pilipes TaxID=299642 RepID=A0A8X6NPF9_NEPPI|nr:hypothetical protein NPIL_53321 [Nephila pilipes]
MGNGIFSGSAQQEVESMEPDTGCIILGRAIDHQEDEVGRFSKQSSLTTTEKLSYHTPTCLTQQPQATSSTPPLVQTLTRTSSSVTIPEIFLAIFNHIQLLVFPDLSPPAENDNFDLHSLIRPLLSAQRKSVPICNNKSRPGMAPAFVSRWPIAEDPSRWGIYHGPYWGLFHPARRPRGIWDGKGLPCSMFEVVLKWK